VGTTVTIMGTSFAGATDVSFGGNVTAPATLVTSTSVTAVVPEGAVTGRLGVTTPAGAATSAAIFKVMPKITGFSPASVVAGAGTTVTITGLNLRAATGSLTVRIGALTIPAILVLTSSSTAIDVRLPAAAITGKLGVTTVDGTGLVGVVVGSDDLALTIPIGPRLDIATSPQPFVDRLLVES